MAHSRVHTVFAVKATWNRLLLNYVVKRKSFKSVGSRFQACTGCGNRESQSSDSFLVRPSHSYSMNTVMTVKECQRRVSTGWQCNQERAWRTSCAWSYSPTVSRTSGIKKNCLVSWYFHQNIETKNPKNLKTRKDCSPGKPANNHMLLSSSPYHYWVLATLQHIILQSTFQ